MPPEPNGNEATSITSLLEITQDYRPGASLQGFFERLAKEAALYGRRCEACGRVSCPPRDFCAFCFGEPGKWVRTGPGGEICTLTIIGARFAGFPEPPYAICFVQPDGADTTVLGYLEGRDWSLQQDWSCLVGQRCQAQFDGERIGAWCDFRFVL